MANNDWEIRNKKLKIQFKQLSKKVVEPATSNYYIFKN